MARDHDKNLGSQESEPWQDTGSIRKKSYSEESMSRYGGPMDMRNGARGYYSDVSQMPSSMAGKNRDSTIDHGFHSRGMARSPPPRIPHEDADLSDAMMFLNKIKEEYMNDMVTYDNFLETMRDFKFGKIDAEEVCRAVRVLFRDKPHLIETFNDYLPSHLKFYGSLPQGSGSRLHDRPPQAVGSSPQYRGGLCGHGGRTSHPQAEVSGPSHMNPQRGIHQGYINQPLIMHSSVKVSGQNGKRMPYDQRRSEEFERMKARQAQDFIQRVKKRYSHNPSVYRSFVELLQSHQVKSGLFEKMKAEVNSLLWESPDLCEDFERNFVPIRKHMPSDEKSILQRIKELLKSKNLLDDFLKCINYFNQKFINEKDLLELVTPLLRSEELIRGFKAFINYKEPLRETPKSLEKYRKEGSYRILPEEIKEGKQDPIAKEVLNFTCVGCPTFESEDSNYVFLKRNVHEEALFRIEDERSEADLAIERIQHLINALEQIIDLNKDSEISMKDIKMSPGIIKEILKSIYDKSAPEILEGILMKPHIAIPIVIKRLYMVNKKVRLCMRERRKIWREVMERNYHKALDVMGPSYKSSEKSIFTTKNIVETGERGIRVSIDDQKVMADVMDLCKTYIRVNQADGKKTLVSNMNSVLESIFEKLGANEFTIVSDFPLLCIFRFIIIVYERLLEIKGLNLDGLSADDSSSKDESASRYAKVKNLCLEFVKKNIDGYTFEDRIRELTECKGFKLYNIKKMISKIEKQVIALTESKQSLDSLYGVHKFDSGEGLYCFRKIKNAIEIGMMEPGRNEEWDSYVEKFKALTPCEDVKPDAPFLPRTCKKPPITGRLRQNLKIRLSPGTYKIKYIAKSESLYMNSAASSKRKQLPTKSH